MAGNSVLWVRKKLSKRLKGVKSQAQKTKIMKSTWTEAKKKFN